MRLVVYLSAIIDGGDVSGLPQVQVSPGADGTISSVLQIVFAIAGAVAMLVIVVAALRYVTSMGNPQTTAKAKDTILYAVIGLIICVLAFSIVTFVLNNL